MGIGVYIAVMVVSMSSLLPWSLFMTAHQYFLYKFRNSTIDSDGNMTITANQTDMQRSFSALFTVVGSIACLVGAILNSLSTKRFSNKCRVVSGHIAAILSLLPTIALTWINTDDHENVFLIITLATGVALANFGGSGLIGGGILGFAAQQSSSTMHAAMIGQAIVGVLTAIASILSQAIAPSNALLNGRLYFCFACTWVIVTCIVYICVLSNIAKKKIDKPVDDRHRLSSDNDLSNITESRRLLDDDELIDDTLELHHSSSLFDDILHVIVQCKVEFISVLLTAIVTLTAFPAITSLVISSSTGVNWWSDYFVPIGVFLVFAVGDACGRLLYAILKSHHRSILIILSICRILFIPLIYMCNIGSNRRYPHHSIINHDLYFVVINFAFSISNGYLFSATYVSAVERTLINMKELTGSIYSFVVLSGIFIGALIGIFFVTYCI